MSISFDNDNINIADFSVESGYFKYKNARLYNITIDYSTNDDYDADDLRVENIIINGSSYSIEYISFHQLAKDYYKSKVSIKSQMATSSTLGFDDFHLELENTTDIPVRIRDIELQSYRNLHTRYVMRNSKKQNIIKSSKLPSDLSIEEKSTVYLDMNHNHSITSKMNDYEIYFFNPIIEKYANK